MPKSNKNSYQAVCAECGVKFELPFIPTSDKPVYCNNCFKNKRNQSRDNRGGRDRRDRQMYTVTCDKCGKKAQVPFKPSGDKPIYCDECFGKGAKGGGQRSGDNQEINKKLDMIIEALVAAKIIKLPKEEKTKKELKKPAIKKETKVKKASAKKPPAKKKTAAKKKTNTKKKK